MSLTKKLALGAVVAGALALSTTSAEAATFSFENATLSDGGEISGTFDFDAGVFSNLAFTTTTGSAITDTLVGGTVIDYTGGTVLDPAPPFIESQLNNGFAAVTTAPLNGTASIAIDFTADLSTILFGGTTTIVPGSTGIFGNFVSFEGFQESPQNSQARSVIGGLVRRIDEPPHDVPEPLTILGTLVAGGIGAAMKKRKEA